MKRLNPTNSAVRNRPGSLLRVPSVRGSAAGFTMIELAVTLTVLALLMAAVAPMAGAWMANMQIRSTADALQNGLQRARMEAIRRNKNVQFSLVSLSNPTLMDNSCALAATSSSWVISLNDPSSKCGNGVSDTADPMIIESYTSGVTGQRLAVSALQGDLVTAANSVTFDVFGRVAGAGAIAAVNVDNLASGNDFRRLRIVVTSGGSVRMCDPRVTVATDPRYC